MGVRQGANHKSLASNESQYSAGDVLPHGFFCFRPLECYEKTGGRLQVFECILQCCCKLSQTDTTSRKSACYIFNTFYYLSADTQIISSQNTPSARHPGKMPLEAHFTAVHSSEPSVACAQL
jgi:hypothetical protein